MSEFGDRVREARKELGLSQKQLGDRVSVTQQNIGKIESGKAKGTYVLVPLARELGVNITWLATGEGPKFASRGDPELDLMVAQDPKRYRTASELFDRLMKLPPKQLAALERLLDAFSSKDN